jgi:2-octaprenylphenol hydroxylase
MNSHFDIVIVGSGIVGAATALALAKNTTLTIALIDSQKLSADWHKENYAPRVSAISLASQRIFQNLSLWSAMTAKRVSPYQKMHVWDARGSGEIKFDCASVNTSALGFIVEDNVIRSTLISAIETEKNIQILAPLKLKSCAEKSTHIELITEDNLTLQTKLVIAADGGNSWLRAQAGIDVKIWDYQHRAIVTTVRTVTPHANTARQRFLATGPLAFLPLADANLSSIVWSTSPEHAAELLELSDQDFQTELATAFDNTLGEILHIEKRHDFPLQMRHAKNYVQSRVALIGDAAHTIHPLAGQGVNLGLLDAACLVDIITQAQAKNRDYGSLATLRKYERWRKGDNLAMLSFVEAIKYLFGSDSKPLTTMRNIGLNATNNIEFVKKFFTTYATGKRSDLPSLACVGECPRC